MGDIMSHPAVILDPVELFKLVHQKDISNPTR